MTAKATAKVVPSVTIKFGVDNKEPIFSFNGEWSGKRAKIVSQHIFREYLRYMRDARREDATIGLTSANKEQ